MVLSNEPEVEVPKDLLTGQATNPTGAVAQIVPTIGPVVKLTGPLSHPTRLKRKDGMCWL